MISWFTSQILTNNQAEKILVALAIEGTLIEMAEPVHEKVINMLYEQYHCLPIDCYDHPEYLNEVLKALFGMSYRAIVKKIERELGEFASKKSINNFLTLIKE